MKTAVANVGAATGALKHAGASTRALKRRLRSAYMREGIRRVPVGLAAGLRLEVDPAAPVHVYLGTAEVEIAHHIRRLARPGVRCFDVGGHNAYYAMVLARLTDTPVVSFESDPAGIERMRRNVALNPQLADLIELRNLYLSYETNPMAHADTLDGVLAREGLAPPRLLKIDVEGEEANVLRGAEELLRSRPHLIIETHGAGIERMCVEMLVPHGYRPLVVTQRRWGKEHRSPENRWLVARGCDYAAAGAGPRIGLLGRRGGEESAKDGGAIAR